MAAAVAFEAEDPAGRVVWHRSRQLVGRGVAGLLPFDTVVFSGLRNGGTVEFRLLGPVELSVDGCLVDAGRPRQRVVLAALLVDAGRVVTPEVLIDRVWGEAPPLGARRALHAHLTRIRRLLERDGTRRAPLVHRSGGYLLDVDPQTVDLHRFRWLVAGSRGTDCAEDDRVQRLRDALQLWQGEPLAGLTGGWVTRARQSWLQERLDATVAWADTELSIGNAEVTIGPLTDLAAEHPLLEPLAAVLLRALHAAGRPAAALDHYAVLRERLADQLGVDPSAQVQAVHQAILRGEPAMTPTQPVSGRQPPPKADRTLPADVVGFVGRHEELQCLLGSWAVSGVRAVAIHAVDGMAGVGKTAFAVHAAHRLAAGYPDGQQFVCLRAHAPAQTAVDPAEALAILLQADGVAVQQIPAGLDARANLWRERIADKKMLLVLDDAADAAHVTPLLPAAPGCLVLITSRRKLATLPGATLLSLDTLPPADAAQLFIRRAGLRDGHDPDAVARITHLCGYLPLAITLTAARLYIHPTWDLADLADDLTQTRDRLTELASGDLAVAAAFDLSYRDIPAERQRLFRRLALHPGPDFDAYAAAALDHTTLTAARRGLEDLLEHNLLTEPHRGRYRFHDLIAEHARTHATTDPQPDQDAAVDRLLSYYHYAATTAARHQPGYHLAVALDHTPAQAPTVTDLRQASDWFTAEQVNLAAAAAEAAARHHPAAIGIPAALHEHLRNRGLFDLAIKLNHTALAAARHTGNQPAHAHTLINLAQMQCLTGDYTAATAAAERAGALYLTLGDPHGQASTLATLARVQFLTDHPAAAATAEQAHTRYLTLGDPRGQALTLDTLARIHGASGDFPAAADAAERANVLYRQAGDVRGRADTLDLLARVQHVTGHYAAAVTTAEQARTLYQQTGNRLGQANTLNVLARVQHLTGDCPAAIATAEHAHTLHQQIGNRRGQAMALDTLARLRHATSDYPAAAAFAERAQTLYQQLPDLHGAASTVQILGVVHHATGDHPAAETNLDQALKLFRDIGDPNGEAETLNLLGQLHLDSAKPPAAHHHFTTALDIARRIGTPTHEARALEGIGNCLLHQGDHNAGIQHLQDAMAIYKRIHSAHAARVEDSLKQQRH